MFVTMFLYNYNYPTTTTGWGWTWTSSHQPLVHVQGWSRFNNQILLTLKIVNWTFTERGNSDTKFTKLTHLKISFIKNLVKIWKKQTGFWSPTYLLLLFTILYTISISSKAEKILFFINLKVCIRMDQGNKPGVDRNIIMKTLPVDQTGEGMETKQIANYGQIHLHE